MHSMGGLGVLLFFTLSGFLITYLLLEEEMVFGKVNIKQFYIRRILRIWPLYFLVFILAFFVLTHISFFQIPGFYLGKFDSKIVGLLFVFFLSNVFLAFYGILPYASQTWSVAVEEQFYLVWPLILRISKNKIVTVFLSIIFIISIRIILSLNQLNNLHHISAFRILWNMFNIDCMAIGAVMAILLFKKSLLLKYLVNLPVFIGALLIAVIFVCFNIEIPVVSIYLKNDFFAVLFSVIILNLATNKSLRSLLELKWLNYLGKISYGLYMYHSIAIIICLKTLIAFDMYSAAGMLLFTILLTVLFSHLSYNYFESPFLKIKSKFSKISTLQ